VRCRSTNTGSFLADSYAGLGFAEAVGVAGYAQQSSQLVNADGGQIHAVAGVGNGYAFAYGILFDAGEYARLDNAGSILAEANTYDSAAFQDEGGMARTIGASLVAENGDSLLYNADGASIAAISSVHGEYGRAYAFGAVAQGGNQARVTNEGSILADAYTIAGDAISLGDLAYGTFAVNLNYGEVNSQASVAGAGFAMAIGQYSFGEVSTVLNAGDTFAHADVGDGAAYAIGARLQGAYVAAYNDGQLQAEAQAGSGLASAQGIAAYGFYGASVDNNGELGAVASVGSGDASAVGAYAYAYVAGAYVSNVGSIAAEASTGYGTAAAYGALAISYIYGPAAVYNQGEILASASGPGDASATGAMLLVYDGYAIAYNAGHIGAVADSFGGSYGTAEATGLHVDHMFGKYNMPIAEVANYGDIEAVATRTGEQGFAQATGASVFAMYAAFYNGGDIGAEASAVGDGAGSSAVATLFSAKYGVDAVNTGGLHAVASAEGGGSAAAIGIIASAYYGSIFLHNEGEILAEATASGGEYGGAAYASGASLHGGYVTAFYNEGSIAAHATAQGGGAEAIGFDGSAKYDVAIVENHGDITAYAQGYYASAVGAGISSKYGAHIDNDGLVAAYALASGAGDAKATGSLVFAPGAHGYFSDAIGAALYNDGEILAEASAAAGQALAIGTRVEGAQDAGAYTGNGGLIHAGASSISGAAFATGSSTWSYYGDVALTNAGDIEAAASAGADGTAVALGAQVRAEGFGPPGYPAGIATLYNAGTILASASTDAGDAFATAARVLGEQGGSADNRGGLAAIASSEGGLAYAAGLVAVSAYGDVMVANSGSVYASADGASGSLATAVYLYSQGVNTLLNSGEIVATGAGSAHVAVQSSDSAIALIDNSGLLAGSILTGALDDQLYNRAGASLWLGNDVIDLGGWSALGNSFVNEGRIRVRGNGNAIDMGAVDGALLPGANPLAFVNDGVIDFVDGAADDVLALAGDLSGQGTIAVDVDAAQLASDQLQIAGSVDPAAVQTLDVHLLSLPTQASSAIAVVTVAGDASADNFVLGEVQGAVDPGLLSLQFGLLADIDASNQRPDAFGLQVEVTGLSDAGALAAAIPSAVARLLASQAGGERGLLLPDDGKGTHLWARVFHAKAGVSAEHEAFDFGQGGNLDFEQRASGIEAGLDFAPNEAWRLGLLLFDVQSSQRLRGCRQRAGPTRWRRLRTVCALVGALGPAAGCGLAPPAFRCRRRERQRQRPRRQPGPCRRRRPGPPRAACGWSRSCSSRIRASMASTCRSAARTGRRTAADPISRGSDSG
jgi:fibronectin-binding autotransporter adhesin